MASGGRKALTCQLRRVDMVRGAVSAASEVEVLGGLPGWAGPLVGEVALAGQLAGHAVTAPSERSGGCWCERGVVAVGD